MLGSVAYGFGGGRDSRGTARPTVPTSLGSPVWGAASTASVVDGSGTTWLVASDGTITATAGPYAGTVMRPGQAGYDAAMEELARQNPAVGQVLEPGSTPGELDFISAIVGLFQKPDGDPSKQAQVQTAVSSGVQTFGPMILSAVQQAASSRGASLASLTNQLAKKQGQYAAAKSTKKRTRLAYEITALRSQIVQAQSAQAAAVQQLSPSAAPAPSSSSGVPWGPIAVGGGLLLITAAVLLGRKR